MEQCNHYLGYYYSEGESGCDGYYPLYLSELKDKSHLLNGRLFKNEYCVRCRIRLDWNKLGKTEFGNE